MKWKVGGTNIFRRKFEAINDIVEAPTIEKAKKKARTKYPKAPELSVQGISEEKHA